MGKDLDDDDHDDSDHANDNRDRAANHAAAGG
jgi:hypothetical protein